MEELRDQLPLVKRCLFLNTGSDGPLPTHTLQAINHMHQWLEENCYYWPELSIHLEQKMSKWRRNFASLLGAQVENVALVRSVSTGVSFVANGMDFGAGDEIIITDEEHESNLLAWMSLCKSLGVKLRIIPVYPDPRELPARIQSVISAKTRLIATSHITCDTGALLPVKEICGIARDYEIPSLVDGGQAAGQVELSVAEIGCDFYLAPGYKWLLGPGGTCLFYVSDPWVQELSLSGWGDKMQEVVDREGYTFTARNDCRRYEFGSSWLPLYAGLDASVSTIKEVGLPQIRNKVLHLRDYFFHEMSQMDGVKVLSPRNGEFASGNVTCIFADWTGAEVCKYLWTKGMVVTRSTYRGLAHSAGITGVRFCLAPFNSISELQRVVLLIRGLLETK